MRLTKTKTKTKTKTWEPQSGVRTPVKSTGLPKPERNADERRY